MSSSDEVTLPDFFPSSPVPAVFFGPGLLDSAGIAAQLAEVQTLAPAGSEEAKTILARITALAGRLEKGSLQLAVVGQFKRGKSTLLNAFLGAELLPAAVTPLTALPTFIRYGRSMRLMSEDASGAREVFDVPNVSELREFLEARVTEDGNPRNRRELTHVEIEVPAPVLAPGLVFIDTPGVGSTYRHNTAAAEAALPECDAALFVVSPDPPITEVEVAYLKQLQQATRTITVIFNKFDTLEERDRETSERFLRRVVGEAFGTQTVKFFSVSARTALAAKLNNDEEGVVRSGFRALEDEIAEFARSRRLPTLEMEIAHKGAGLVRELAFITELQIAARQMPLSDLSERLNRFRATLPEFQSQRDASCDRLRGDRERLLADLDRRAAALCNEMETRLLKKLHSNGEEGCGPDAIWTAIAENLPEQFEGECARFQSVVRTRLSDLLARYQQEADELIALVRKAAATLLDIPYRAPEASAAFQMRKIPYWVTAPRETLGTVPNDLLGRALPGFLWKGRRRKLAAQQIKEVVTRNVENLRWALRQNLEEAIRAFQMDLDDKLASAERATEEAIETGLERRTDMERGGLAEIDMLTNAGAKLHAIAAALLQRVGQ